MSTTPELPPRKVFRLPGGETMAFRRIEAKAPFRMGSRGYSPDEEPIHRVRLAHVYWLAETPVTQAQFQDWTTRQSIKHENNFPDFPKHPAESLSWHQAIKYCDWLTQKIPGLTSTEPLPDGCTKFCLPTEAEWEYAARAGSETEYWNGDGEAALREVGWYYNNLENRGTQPVAGKDANPFGLFDVHGNVWEWCHDLFQADAYRGRAASADDPGFDSRSAEYTQGISQMLANNSSRVLRGGSWRYNAGNCRSAYRNRYRADDWIHIIGFRVCLVRGPGAASPDSQAEPGASQEGLAEPTPTPEDGSRGTRLESPGVGDGEASDLAHAHLPVGQSDFFPAKSTSPPKPRNFPPTPQS